MKNVIFSRKMKFIVGLLLINFSLAAGSFDAAFEQTVEAAVGDKAAIPCSVSTPLEDDQATLILWYRVDMPNPIYTLDIRNVPFKGARHFPSTEMGARAKFDLSVHPPVLVLYPVLEEDQGDYKCRVDLRRSRTLILHSRLRVIVPPSDPIIMDEHGQHLYDIIGPYDEGANLTFICEVDGGDPSPNVTWWQGSTLLDDDFNVTTQGFVRNEMFLYKIQRTDLMSEYTCRAENTQLTKPKEKTLILDINLLPLEARIVLPKPILIAGEEHEILCETKGSRPRALTTWWLDNQKIALGLPEGLLENANNTLSTLHFTPKPSDDGKHLMCKSVNPILPKKIVEDEITLKVQFIPLVNISLGPSMTKPGVKEGSEIHLDCTIWANPWINNITWQFENKNLTSNKVSGVIIRNQSLIIRNVNKNHRGRYRCLANNTVGEGRSKYLRVYVQFTPVCRSLDPRIYGISPTEILNVTCDLEADPKDIQIRWSLNNSLGLRALSNWTKGSLRSVFHYSPKTEEGYGVLMCWGKNTIGMQKEPCLIKVVPAGAPESPHDCVITNQTSRFLVVECEAGYNGSLSQIFHMEVYDSIMEHMTENLTNFDKPSFKATDLNPGESYVLVIYASNVKGKSNSVALVGTTLLPAEKRTAQDESTSISPVLLILIGVVVLFIASTVITILIVKIRMHFERKETKDKDTCIQTTTTSCDIPKKDLEESQDPSEKGPDIIPMSKDSEVFYMGKVSEDPMFDIKPDESPSGYVHQKYTDTVL